MSGEDKKNSTTVAGKKITRIQLQNQRRIIEAALGVFSIYGYRGSTIVQIAERAKMSKPNLLYYFKNKHEIYAAVLEHTLAVWLEPLAQLNPEGEPLDEIWKYTKRKLELSRTAPEASRLFATEILQGAPVINNFLETQLKSLVSEKCSVIQCWIDQGYLKPVAPLHLIFFIWATTQHYADFSVQIDILNDSTHPLFEDAEKSLKTIIIAGIRVD